MEWSDKKTSAVVVITLVAVGLSCFFYFQWRSAVAKNTAGPSVEQETAEIVEIISSRMELPEGEIPQLVTVTSLLELQKNPFFVKAEEGDKVLVYKESDKVVLYRPRTEKIIEVGSFLQTSEVVQDAASDTADSGLSAAQSGAPQTVVKVAYYNGSGVTGRAKEYESRMKEWFVNTETITLSNAKSFYPYTVVVDLKGSFSVEVDEIARRLGGKVESFPEVESRPDADILIILGEY